MGAAPLLLLAARPAAATPNPVTTIRSDSVTSPLRNRHGHRHFPDSRLSVLPDPMQVILPDQLAERRVLAASRSTFLANQLAYARVHTAQLAADVVLRSEFANAGLTYPATNILLRAFKRERQLEVWVQRPDGSYTLFHTYPICTLGGSDLGPKRRQGDEQVPEGFYHIVAFNPQSEYHLSLRVDYPNAVDRLRAGDRPLGGDIFLHGGCKSAGCLPLTDAVIDQVYWLAAQARAAGEREIPIHIFPARLTPKVFGQLRAAYGKDPSLLAFWANLKQGYDAFEGTHRLLGVGATPDGRYSFDTQHVLGVAVPQASSQR